MKAHDTLTRIRVEEALNEGLASQALRRSRPGAKIRSIQKLLHRIFHSHDIASVEVTQKKRQRINAASFLTPARCPECLEKKIA